MLPCLFRALDIRREMKDTLGLASLYNNIGSAYRGRDNYREAVKYYTTSLGLFKENGQDSACQAAVLNNLGLIHDDIGMYDLARDYLRQALQKYEPIAQDTTNGNSWLNMGEIYRTQGLYPEALSNVHQARVMFEKTGNILSLPETHHTLASITGTWASRTRPSTMSRKAFRPTSKLEMKRKSPMVNCSSPRWYMVGSRRRRPGSGKNAYGQMPFP